MMSGGKGVKLPMVKLLIAKGANPAGRGVCDCTPLIVASSTQNEEAVKYFLTFPKVVAGIDAHDRDGKTALWWACRQTNPMCARQLLDSGADPSVCNVTHMYHHTSISESPRLTACINLLKVSTFPSSFHEQ